MSDQPADTPPAAPARRVVIRRREPRHGCHDCSAWVEDLSVGQPGREGECRPGPPVVAIDADGATHQLPNPNTTAAYWCRAWAPRLAS